MKWLLKFLWARLLPSPSQACLAILTTAIVVFVVINYSDTPGLPDQRPALRTGPSRFDSIYKHQLVFSPESNFKADVRLARSEHNCRAIQPGKTNGMWSIPKLAVEHATPPPFLPEYKNPCWRSPSNKSGESTLYCLPYFHIAGFAKCASTDLFRRVSQHPLIIPGIKKEPQYLSRGDWSSCANRHKLVKERTRCFIKEYASKFYSKTSKAIQQNILYGESKFCKTDKNCNQVTSTLVDNFRNELQDLIAEESLRFKYPMVTVDSSACYAADNQRWKEMAENQGCPEPIVGPAHLISKMNPNVFALFIVRDPTERLYSSYFHFNDDVTLDSFHKRVKKAVAGFKSCIKSKPFYVCLVQADLHLDVGIYHVHIARWLRLLPRSQILVIENESYKRDMPGTLAKIFRFLKLPALSEEALEAIANMDKQGVGEAKSKLTGMFPETEKILREFYAEHNEMLAKLLDDNRFAWRK